MYKSKVYKEDLERICKEKLPYELLKGKTVLITGANGLIGSCITDVLLELNRSFQYDIEILALCRNREKAEKRFGPYLAQNYFTLVHGDVTQPLPIKKKIDYIIHAASNAHPLAYAAEPVETMKANILGIIHLLEHGKAYGLQRLLFLSSSEIYGDNIHHLSGFQEEELGYLNSMSDRACYPESKRAAEALCVSYAREYQLDTVVARPGYIYGITMNEDNSRADIQFVRRAMEGKDIIMKSRGSQLRSYCYLSDAVTALFYILLQGKSREAYNIANKDCNVTISEFAHTLAAEAGVKVVYDQPKELEQQGYTRVMNSVLNADKLSALGWEAKIDLKTGIHRLLQGLTE